MNTAPVILFVYNRPDHTAKTLDALAGNSLSQQTDLIIYADGAKPGASENEMRKIEAIKKLIGDEKRFRTTTIYISEKNKGLANSIIDGVTETVNKYGSVIVMEDDLVTSPHFLSFMNQALQLYADNKEVACISGYIYPVREKLPGSFFLKGADCWGWATWKRSWDIFEKKGEVLYDKLLLNGHSADFDFYDSYPYMQMLKDQIHGKNKSWAIRWYASAYLEGMLTLYPGQSLVKNIGFDGSGEHSGKKKIAELDFPNDPVKLHSIPLVEDSHAKKVVASYFRQTINNSFKSALKRKMTRLLQKILGN